MLLLLGIFVGQVVADARLCLLVHACHSGAPSDGRAWAAVIAASQRASMQLISLSLRDYASARNAASAAGTPE
jgi:hypothetical protein